MTVNLEPYHLTRPEKIRWRFPSLTPDESVTPHILSKGLRKFLSNVDELLAAKQITWTLEELSAEQFGSWLEYYQQKMLENQYDVIASQEWFAKKTALGQKVLGLLMYQQGKLVGSGIFAVNGTEKATFAFKATDRLDLTNTANSSLGAVIDYLFLREMHQRGIQLLSAGQSRNAFGVVNTLGYLDYKLRFGYQPSFGSKTPLSSEVPLGEDGTVVFYAQSTLVTGPRWALYALTPANWTGTWEVARFATEACPFISLTYPL